MKIRVILVKTQFSGNIGSIARVMKNFGFSELALANPECDPFNADARRMSCQGEDVLDKALVFNSLREAIGDCEYVVATTARLGGLIRSPISHDLSQGVVKLFEQNIRGKVAIVFGQESSGLTTSDISLCNLVFHVPTSEVYPALNLSMAVGITLYEISCRNSQNRESETGATTHVVATMAMQDMAFQRLRKALEKVNFLFGEKAMTLFAGIRSMISRAKPTPQEIKWLHGFSRQLEWFAKRQRPET